MRERNSLDQSQDDRIKALEDGMTEILKVLRPISETYTTASVLGKWLMALAVFISVLIGLLIGLKTLFKHA